MIMTTVDIAFVSVFTHDGGEKGDDLYRFAEAHIIAEQTSEAFNIMLISERDGGCERKR
jgi:hypothetical protein